MTKYTSALTSHERIELVLANQIEDECLTEEDLLALQNMVMEAIAKKKLSALESPFKKSNAYVH